MIAYLRDPQAIYARSFAIIRSEADLSHLPPDAEAIATRVIHACGMPEIAADLRIADGFVAAATAAIAAGKPVLVDAEMVRHGIIDKSLNVICTLNDPEARRIGIATGTTRSAAAVDLWRPHLDGAIVVIGNAPTALFALLEAIDAGAPQARRHRRHSRWASSAPPNPRTNSPPIRAAFPSPRCCGRKGGSAMAAAVVNALTRGAA